MNCMLEALSTNRKLYFIPTMPDLSPNIMSQCIVCPFFISFILIGVLFIRILLIVVDSPGSLGSIGLVSIN